MKRSVKAALRVTVSSIALVPILGATALAQSEDIADAQTEDIIIVTGIRASIQKAADIKRNSDIFVDSIIAEDIGKLADENVAEALSRVTGVQVRRSSTGEGDQVDIRGLALNRISLNSRTLPAFQGRQSGNSDRDNGEINILGIIPSEIVSRIDVTKLPSADQVEGSIGGNIDIITRRPLDSEGLSVSASVQGLYADLAAKSGYKGSFLISDSFVDDTFGVLLGATYIKRSVREDRFFSFSGFQNVTADESEPDAFQPVNGNPVYRINDLRYQRLESDRDTLTLNGSLQWQPNDDVNLYADVIYSGVDIDERRSWLRVSLPGTPAGYDSFDISPNGTIIAGSFAAVFRGNTNVNPVNEFDAITAAVGGEFQLSQKLAVEVDFSYSQSELNSLQNFVLNQTTSNVQATFDFGAGEIPSLRIENLPGSDVALDDFGSYEFLTFFNNRQGREATDYAGRIDFDYQLDNGFLKNFEFGGRLQSLEAVSSTLLEFAFPGTEPLSDPTFAPFGVLASFDDVLPGVNVDFPRIGIVGNPLAFGLNTCESGLFGDRCTGPQPDSLAGFTANEDTYAGYAKVNFESDFGSVPFSAQVGARVVHTDVSIDGFQSLDEVISPTTVTTNYTDLLPSATIKFDVRDDLVVRFGAAQILRRPEPSELRPGYEIVIDGDTGEVSGSGGNVNLEPFRANTFDASVEWYADSGAYSTIGLFYKDVKSFTSRETALLNDFPGFEGTPVNFERTVNGFGATLKGVEWAGQLPFTFLPGALDGLGVLANYTYVDADVDEQSGAAQTIDERTGQSLPFSGISKHSFNVIGYYEKGPISLRAGYNWRDDFLLEVNQETGVFAKAVGNLNASLRYRVNDNISIDFEATNLTRSAQRQFAGFEDSVASYAITDRRFFGGVRIRY